MGSNESRPQTSVSNPQTLETNSTRMFPTSNSKKYALLVINTYDLPNALNDAIAQVPMLLNWGFIPANITILVDETSEHRLDLLSNFSTVISNNGHNFISKYNDILETIRRDIGTDPADIYLGISSHGGQTPDDNGDEPDNLDEYIAPAGVPIRDDQITEYFKNFNPNVTVLAVSDACHSGTMFDDISLPPKIIRISSANDDESSSEVYMSTDKLLAFMETQERSDDYVTYLSSGTIIVGELTNQMIKNCFDEVTGSNISEIIKALSTAYYGTNRVRNTTSSNTNWILWLLLALFLVIIFIFLVIGFSNRPYPKSVTYHLDGNSEIHYTQVY